MALTIFYSWQSDLPSKINRNFIEDALNKAIKKVGRDISVQAALRDETIKLDKDTKGVPGIPPIAEVIFEKISQCEIFVPDFTFVGKTEGGRLLPNPNVLIEYGWALKELTYARIVPIMNSAFGEPSSKTLPFDMRHLRRPLNYYLSENVTTEERATAKSQLIKDLFKSIELIIKKGLTDQIISKTEPFKETHSTTNASTFLQPGETFATIDTIRGTQKTIYLPDVECLFLRVTPTVQLDPM